MDTDFITLLGDVQIPAPNKHFQRITDEYILYMILDGHMTLVENNIFYQLYQGDILLLEPHMLHYGVKVNSPITYSFLHLSMDNFFAKANLYDDYKELQRVFDIKKLSLPPEAFRETMQLYDNLKRVYHSTSPYRNIKMGSLFTIFLVKLLEFQELLNPSLKRKNHTDTTPAPRQLSKELSNFLRQNCQKPLQSRELENKFHHNFDYMNRVFKCDFGMTIFQYLENYRIEEAKKMLQSHAFSITQIAESLGFCNTYYFSRVFKKKTGIAPSYWSKKH